MSNKETLVHDLNASVMGCVLVYFILSNVALPERPIATTPEQWDEACHLARQGAEEALHDRQGTAYEGYQEEPEIVEERWRRYLELRSAQLRSDPEAPRIADEYKAWCSCHRA